MLDNNWEIEHNKVAKTKKKQTRSREKMWWKNILNNSVLFKLISIIELWDSECKFFALFALIVFSQHGSCPKASK